MFENLSNNLARAIKTLKGQGRITALNIASTTKEIRRALIQADVNYKLAKQITDSITAKALGSHVLTAVSPGQLFTKVVGEELATLMGSKQAPINLLGKPALILMIGLQGSGKTTFSGKLALHLKNQNKSVLLAACDVYRPAAIEQLQILGDQLGIPVYTDPGNKNVLQIAEQAIKQAQGLQKQVVIIDTAGRQAIDAALMQELTALKVKLKPAETLLVVDAMAGQDAVNTAQAFHDQVDFDGVVLTKLDGDTRGGAALSIRAVINKPIKFIGTGEKLEALDIFHPDRMAKRILGMGDVVSLVERAEQAYDAQEAQKLSLKISKNQFNLTDLLQQIKQIEKMGNIKDLMGMIPGMGKFAQQADNFQEDTFKVFATIIQSMTPKERTYPHILNKSRKERIAKGSGTSIEAINRLLKQFDAMCQIMKKSQQGSLKHTMKLFNRS